MKQMNGKIVSGQHFYIKYNLIGKSIEDDSWVGLIAARCRYLFIVDNSQRRPRLT